MTQAKIALVTGGSRGLGKDMALSLAKRGIDVILTYHSQKEAAEVVVAEIQQAGQKAAALQLDASDLKGFDAFIESVQRALKETFGTDKIDFLVNNGGTAMYVPFASATEAQFDESLNVHFKGVFFLTQKALPIMADGGGIVNISSGLARFSHDGSSVYATMKSAVETLTRYLAKELGPRKIRANVVAPGAIQTDFGGGRVRNSPQLQEMLIGVTALGRVGLADDVGGVVAFLCSDDAKWVNGQRIEVAGGVNL